MAEPFLGEIRMFGFNFTPRGWAQCNGVLLPISSNSALFSLLGTIYGGDGRTTFALPDLRGRAPLHYGQGNGLSNHPIGQRDGTETATLTAAQMPSHTHQSRVASGNGSSTSPVGNVLATSIEGDASYSGSADNNGSSAAIANTGGGQPHNNMQPFLAINFCIALVGIFPSRS